MRFIISLITIYFVIVLMAFLMQRWMIYFPDKSHPHRKAWGAEAMQAISLKTEDGLSLLAWYQKAAAGKPTLVYFHGNAGHIGHRVPLLAPYMVKGYGVLLVEYRGYGGNAGVPSEQGVYRDAVAAMKFLQQQSVKTQCVVLVGESLGTAVAIEMATRYPVKALILQSPFTSLVAVGAYHYPFLPLRWLLFDRYDSLSKIKQLKAPILFLTGVEDHIIPAKQVKQLYQTANSPKQLIAMPGVGHNNLLFIHKRDAIEAFLASTGEGTC